MTGSPESVAALPTIAVGQIWKEIMTSRYFYIHGLDSERDVVLAYSSKDRATGNFARGEAEILRVAAISAPFWELA